MQSTACPLYIAVPIWGELEPEVVQINLADNSEASDNGYSPWRHMSPCMGRGESYSHPLPSHRPAEVFAEAPQV